METFGSTGRSAAFDEITPVKFQTFEIASNLQPFDRNGLEILHCWLKKLDLFHVYVKLQFCDDKHDNDTDCLVGHLLPKLTIVLNWPGVELEY